MKDFKDELYRYFEEHLARLDWDPDENATEFAQAVVSEYWPKLKERGVINAKFADEIRKDLEAEVVEMLQKKIYGHFNLKHYRDWRNKRRA